MTKSDSENADIDSAVQQLKRVIPNGPIVISSSITGKGIQEIKDLVNCNTMLDMREYAETKQSELLIFV